MSAAAVQTSGLIEVVQDPRGGLSLAVPVGGDSTVRIYCGWSRMGRSRGRRLAARAPLLAAASPVFVRSSASQTEAKARP